ncbi:MAG: hypothetical protein D6832_06965 [Alphaproteobacteria bacterium]|nr:MAG: hypothetical protein D6832_06965 [Alphaproteobacteria bacterium]
MTFANRIRPLAGRITGLVLAGALAASTVLATPAPARAGNDDFVKFLAGATAIYIIGSAIAQSQARPVTRRVPAPVYAPPRWKTAPAACRVSVRTRGGWGRGYLAGCTRSRVARPAALPAACLDWARTSVGWRQVYRGLCLRRNGWRA